MSLPANHDHKDFLEILWTWVKGLLISGGVAGTLLGWWLNRRKLKKSSADNYETILKEVKKDLLIQKMDQVSEALTKHASDDENRFDRIDDTITQRMNNMDKKIDSTKNITQQQNIILAHLAGKFGIDLPPNFLDQ